MSLRNHIVCIEQDCVYYGTRVQCHSEKRYSQPKCVHYKSFQTGNFESDVTEAVIARTKHNQLEVHVPEEHMTYEQFQQVRRQI